MPDHAAPDTAAPDTAAPDTAAPPPRPVAPGPRPAALPAALPVAVDLPAIEREVLDRWQRLDVFARTVSATAGGPRWVFYEGPPTANGRPGAHHVESRAFKDLYCRYRTMKGFHVERRAGWDCHGLPVELAVEKELGFRSKHDIEAYGIAEFNERCRESVQRHVGEFERMSARMGYWLDYEDAYWTMDREYIDSVWWSLSVIADKGLLVEDSRVSPYCPRCQTALSDHEVAQGYTEVVDPSVYVFLPVQDGPLAEWDASLLVWTTTPWTLVSNTAVAVHPDVDYVVTEVDGRRALLAEKLLAAVAGPDAEVLARFRGRELERTRYRPPFSLVELPEAAHFVVLADYVTTEDGTGLVHQAPAFGAEDLQVARRYGLPVVNPVGPDGCFLDSVPLVGGRFFKDADPVLIEALRADGLLHRHMPYRHSYPLCWRCDTALLYYALPSWYIRTTAIKDELLAQNAATDWHPPTIRQGRYGDWLENNVDWALSRDRYWGTPLPVWRCEDGHTVVVSGMAELGRLSGRDLSGVDPHRPFIDEVTLPCAQDGTLMRRVPQVIDCWYDSGAMPFAQWGAPHRDAELFEASYPAQFIAEAIDQTRGWFYTLMTVGTAALGRSPYESVLCLGHIVDEDGRKMSKHLGNVLDPFELFEQSGADAVRWLMLATGNPWSARRLGTAALDEIVRKVLLTYYNSASFLLLYAEAAGWSPPAGTDTDGKELGNDEGRPLLDRWLLSQLAATVAEVDAALAQFDSVRAGRRLSALLEDISNWYVRRSRRRFWDGDPGALSVLHHALGTLSRLLAPFVPFLTEYVYSALAGPEQSVHLAPFPAARPADVDPALDAQMDLVRRLVELGRAARADSGVRTRQPLARALVGAPGFAALPEELRRHIGEELNVLDLQALHGDLVEVVVKPNFRALGRRFGARTPEVAGQVDARHYRRETGSLAVTLDGEEVVLGAGELLVTETPRSGWAVASAGGLSVALDLELTGALRRAGLARDLVRRVQEARKHSGLAVSDRIELWVSGDDTAAEALAEHRDLLAGEVLAVTVSDGAPAAPLARHDAPELGLTFWLRPAGQ